MVDLVVIGSNSFSGAHFVRYCLGQGMDVVGISRSVEPIEAFLPYRWREYSGSFKFYAKDLNKDLADIVQIIQSHKPSYVVNFAAQSMVAQSWQTPQQWFNTNTLSPIMLHDYLRQMDFLDRFVQISTPEVYGSCEGVVIENRHYLPSTPYAVSKAAVDMSLQCFYQSYDFPVLYTRAANVYGEGQQLYRIIPRSIMSIKLGEKLPLHGGGVSERNFIHIDDVVDATYKVMESGKVGDIYHISSDKVVSIRHLVEMICTRMGVDFSDAVEVAEERLGKDALYHLSSDKLRNTLNWQPHIDLEQGVGRVVAWAEHYFEQLKYEPLDYQHKP
ncbi:MAG: GDP-mannose 4,6-dehydratase [Pseudomonadales bacterium]